MKISALQHNAFQRSTWHFRRGITLIEILIVVCIIAVLAFIGFPMITKMRDKGKSVTCISNVRQVGLAILMYTSDRSGKLVALEENKEDGSRGGDIWPITLAKAGYMWNGEGKLPCGTGVWTCPACDFASDAYGGYGVVEQGIFDYVGNTTAGHISKIENPSTTWLVGDVKDGTDPKKPWYAIWQNPTGWTGHGPAVGRHPDNKVNVCMFDGHVEALTVEALKAGEYTYASKDAQ